MSHPSFLCGQVQGTQYVRTLYLVQQLLNGLTIGSTYALIAIGYTMVYGIIGMINFAHGEVYMTAPMSLSW